MRKTIYKSVVRKFLAITFITFAFLSKSFTSEAQSPIFHDMVGELRRTFSGCSNPNPSVKFFYDLSPHETDSGFFRPMSYDTSNVNIWYSLYREMYYAAYDTTAYIKDSIVFDNSWNHIIKDTIPLAIMDYKYNLLDSGALDTNIFFDKDTVLGILSDKVGRPYAPYTIQNIFACSPLLDQWDYLNPLFMVNPAFIFADSAGPGCNTCVWPGHDIKVDFSDGTGWHIFSQTSTSYYRPTYSTTGVKLIKFGLFNSTTGALAKYSVAAFRINNNRLLRKSDSVFTFVEGLTVSLFEGCEGSANKKYVIYLEGMDPLNNRNGDRVYDEMVKGDTIEQLKNFGYNFLVVNFDHPYDDIRNNGYRVMSLINILKGKHPDLAPLVVIGESMGGLIGRYALRKMELGIQWPGMTIPPQDPIKMHNTRLFITVDAPNKGANIPLAYQYLYRYGTLGLSSLYSAFSIGVLGKYGILLDGISTRQMLLYHINTDLAPFAPISTSTFGPDWRKDALDAEFDAIDRFPKYCKNLAISSGSWLGHNQTRYWDYTDRVPNDYFFKINVGLYIRVLGIKLLGTNMDFALRSNPDMVAGTVFRTASTISRWKIKWKKWRPKLEYTTTDLIKIEKGAVNVRPYCSSAASFTFSDIKIGKGTPGTTKLNVLGLFWLNTNTSDGHIGWDAEIGIPWLLRVGATYDMYTDGTSFGFVPPMSSFDDDSFYVKPLDDNMLAYSIPDIMSRSKYDAVITNPFNAKGWWHSNKDHLTIPNPRLGECVTCSGPTSISPVFSNLLNREIGDDTLWLENTRAQIQFRIAAERGLYVNFRNPYYNYNSTSAIHSDFVKSSSGTSLFQQPFVLSKEDDYQILYGTPEFVSNDDFDETGLAPGSYVNSTGYMVLCCRNYLTERRGSSNPIEENGNPMFISIMPNPSGSGQEIRVAYNFKDNINIKMEVYNMLGQRVASYNPDCDKNISPCLYSMTLSVPSGVYILKLNNGKEQQNTRFVIQ
jgi:hypothetical protein